MLPCKTPLTNLSTYSICTYNGRSRSIEPFELERKPFATFTTAYKYVYRSILPHITGNTLTPNTRTTNPPPGDENAQTRSHLHSRYSRFPRARVAAAGTSHVRFGSQQTTDTKTYAAELHVPTTTTPWRTRGATARLRRPLVAG